MKDTQDALDEVPQTEAEWLLIREAKRHLAVFGADRTTKLLAAAKGAVQPAPKPARTYKRGARTAPAARRISCGALVMDADLDAIRRAGESLAKVPYVSPLEDLSRQLRETAGGATDELLRQANLLAPLALSDEMQAALDKARKATLIGADLPKV